MDLRSLYDRLQRDPDDYPLFERIWQVLTFAPSSKHADEEVMVSLACDAFDYLQASGAWQTASQTGTTQLHWNGRTLRVKENDGREFHYEHTFTVTDGGDASLRQGLDGDLEHGLPEQDMKYGLRNQDAGPDFEDGLEDGLATPYS
ncbi:MAG: hypothetical protein K0R39_2379 [Symbiobacteriaceae bacterium]|jgi:hypothetical protein|nr:hypothetical protein [Symbiobacteriaceae bacterium]